MFIVKALSEAFFVCVNHDISRAWFPKWCGMRIKERGRGLYGEAAWSCDCARYRIFVYQSIWTVNFKQCCAAVNCLQVYFLTCFDSVPSCQFWPSSEYSYLKTHIFGELKIKDCPCLVGFACRSDTVLESPDRSINLLRTSRRGYAQITDHFSPLTASCNLRDIPIILICRYDISLGKFAR
jgi:hypothetical protein